MKKWMTIFIALLSVSALALAVMSQSEQLTNRISLQEDEVCGTVTYNEVQPIMGECSLNWTAQHCLNTTGENSACSTRQDSRNWTCKTGEQTIQKQREECTPQHKYEITLDSVKKTLSFDDFGPCSYEAQDDCVVVTCVSWNDGAHEGQFMGCRNGMTCQRVTVCPDDTTYEMKNSLADFSSFDPSFRGKKLQLEAGQ